MKMEATKTVLTAEEKRAVENTMNDIDIYITVKKASELRGISKSELYDLMRRKKIKSIRPSEKPRGKIYTKLSWIDEYLDALLIKEETGSKNPYDGIVVLK